MKRSPDKENPAIDELTPEHPETWTEGGDAIVWEKGLYESWVVLLPALILILLTLFLMSPWFPWQRGVWNEFLGTILQFLIGVFIYVAFANKFRFVVSPEKVLVQRKKKDEYQVVTSASWDEFQAYAELPDSIVLFQHANSARGKKLILPLDLELKPNIVQIMIANYYIPVNPSERVRFLWWQKLKQIIEFHLKSNFSLPQFDIDSSDDYPEQLHYKTPFSTTEKALPLFAFVMIYLIYYYLGLSPGFFIFATIILLLTAFYLIMARNRQVVIDTASSNITIYNFWGRYEVIPPEHVRGLRMSKRLLPWPAYELRLEFVNRSDVTLLSGYRLREVQNEGSRLQAILKCEFYPIGLG